MYHKSTMVDRIFWFGAGLEHQRPEIMCESGINKSSSRDPLWRENAVPYINQKTHLSSVNDNVPSDHSWDTGSNLPYSCPIVTPFGLMMRYMTWEEQEDVYIIDEILL